MKQINFGIIVSGGSGKRMGENTPKQFITVAGKPILQYSLEQFVHHKDIHAVVLVSHPDYIGVSEEIAAETNSEKEIQIVPGGNERYLSVLEGLKVAEMAEPFSNVIIHDAVRPNIAGEIIGNVAKALRNHEAVSTVLSVRDTIYQKTNKGIVIPKRSDMFYAQTPQAFRLSALLEAYLFLRNGNGFVPTDDVSVYKNAFPDKEVFLLEGNSENVKITYPSDLQWFRNILKS